MRVEGQNPDDPGVRLLARALAGWSPADVLLVHCGDLPSLGAGATRLICDIREAQGSVARVVADEPGTNVGGPFGAAAVWPRAHLGLDFARRSLAVACVHTRPGGRVLCAARKNKGAERLGDALAALCGHIRVRARDRGYRLFEADRPDALDREIVEEATEARYRIQDPALGEIVLAAGPGVFSRKGLDAGTRALIRYVSTVPVQPATIVDLGCGAGALAIWAARRWPAARVTAVDTNLLAVAATRQNAVTNGVADRVEVLAHDGMPPPGRAELALVNPPTHAPAPELAALLAGLAGCRRAVVVVNRPGRAATALRSAGAAVELHERDGYVILDARFRGV